MSCIRRKIYVYECHTPNKLRHPQELRDLKEKAKGPKESLRDLRKLFEKKKL